MRLVLVLLAALAAGAGASPAAGEETGVDAARPVVVKTTPAAGAKGVDPALSDIKVTFDKDMTDKSWSWAMESAESFPKMAGEPRFEPDKRTAVLPVKLEAGKTYKVWVNSEKHQNFKDEAGRPAVPFLLVFETK
jgi:hypothetical protein